MKKFIRAIPIPLLIALALFMLFAPFQPEPHLWQKTKMLMAGDLQKPIDVFDMLWHLLPSMLLVARLLIGKSTDEA